MAAALRRAALNNTVAPAQVDQAFVMLERAVFLRAQVRPLLSEAWKRRESITVADALYVVLAQHLDATLVTADERLARTPSLGVSTIVP